MKKESLLLNKTHKEPLEWPSWQSERSYIKTNWNYICPKKTKRSLKNQREREREGWSLTSTRRIGGDIIKITSKMGEFIERKGEF